MELNILIAHPNFSERDRRLIFDDDPFTVLPRPASMLDVLIAAEIFPSKGQARKNWQGSVEIPVGLSFFEVGKRRLHLWVHNPPDNLSVDTDA